MDGSRSFTLTLDEGERGEFAATLRHRLSLLERGRLPSVGGGAATLTRLLIRVEAADADTSLALDAQEAQQGRLACGYAAADHDGRGDLERARVLLSILATLSS